MFYGKKKAVTFSFDDGVTQDIRAIEILNKYGLKATFNLNSALLGLGGYLDRNGKRVSHSKVHAGDVKAVYAGHEIACHRLRTRILSSWTKKRLSGRSKKTEKSCRI